MTPLQIALVVAATLAIEVPALEPPEAATIAYEGTLDQLLFYPGEIREVTFAMPPAASRSDQHWPIARVETTCSCVAIHAKDEIVFDAHGACALGVAYSAGYHGGAAGGTCVVRCTDPAGAHRDLIMHVAVTIRDYLTWPRPGALIDLGDPDALGAGWTFRVQRGDHPAAWTTLAMTSERQNGRFAIVVDPEDNSGFLVHLTLHDPHVRGIISDRVKAGFADANGGVLAYAPSRLLRVHMPGGLVSTPSTLFFGFVRPGEEVVKTVSFELADSTTSITAITAPDGRFSHELAHPEHNTLLSVRFKADREEGMIVGDVDVGLSDGTITKIPCLGKVISPAR